MRPTSRWILFFALAPAVALAGDGTARSVAEEAGTMSVVEGAFLAAVDANHPAARALTGDLGAAEARHLQASLLDDPHLELTREAPSDLAHETTLGITWTPPIDGRRRESMRAAQAAVDVETHRLETRLLRLRSEVRETYAAWATGEERAALLAEHGGRLEALARRMRLRAEAGEESLLAAQRLELAARTSTIAWSEATAAAALWRERARRWLPEEARELASGRPRLPALPQAPADLDANPLEVAGARADVLASAAAVARAESLRQLGRRVFAAPELLVGWKSIENDLPGGGGDFEGPVLGVGWQVPLFDRRRAERLEAEAALDAAAAGREWAERHALGELVAALAAYRELRRPALDARARLESLDAVEGAATASFEAGESSVTDLLETLGALLEARLAALDLYASALAAHRQLEVAAGRSLIPGDPS